MVISFNNNIIYKHIQTFYLFIKSHFVKKKWQCSYFPLFVNKDPSFTCITMSSYLCISLVTWHLTFNFRSLIWNSKVYNYFLYKKYKMLISNRVLLPLSRQFVVSFLYDFAAFGRFLTEIE